MLDCQGSEKCEKNSWEKSQRFLLIEGPECHAQVKKLIKSYTYIYPIKEVSLQLFLITIFIMYGQGRGLIICTKPFNHLAVISILCELFFGNT